MEGSAGFFTGAAATAGYFSRGGGGVGGDSEFDTKTMDNIITNNNINSNFAVDDLLDFPKEDDAMTDAFFDSFTCGSGGGGGVGNSGDSSSLTVVDSCNSSVSGADAQFNGSLSCRSFTDTQFSGTELCVPYDELAELEWLSTFVEESFSSDELQNLQIISPSTNSKTIPAAVTAITDTSSSATTNTTSATATVTNSSSISSHIFSKDLLVPGKARSKRSRAAPCDWSSRLLHLSSPANSSSDTNNNSNSSSSNTVPEHHPLINGQSKAPKSTNSKRREASTETPGRKCLHCASDKTPQWRTGPMGPKTLCNACGVRYKSGRLVPEYRPAASPTFVSARHSNSHRKVLELRRQKEMQRQHHQQQHLMNQAAIFGVSNGGDEFLIHHHHPHQQNVGTDYRLMI